MPQTKRNLEAKVVPSLDGAEEDPQHTNLYDDPWEFESPSREESKKGSDDSINMRGTKIESTT